MDDRWAVGAAGGFHTILDHLEKMLQGSNETYAFGTEEFDPEQIFLREQYGEMIYPLWPELQKFNPIRRVRIFDASIEKVWKAISDKDQMKKWYFDIPDFKPEAGADFTWYAAPPDGKQWLHAGEIKEVVCPNRLAYSWYFPGYTGEALTIWELTSVASNKTKLDFKFEIIIPFDPNEDELARKNFVFGWDEIINRELLTFLARNEV